MPEIIKLLGGGHPLEFVQIERGAICNELLPERRVLNLLRYIITIIS